MTLFDNIWRVVPLFRVSTTATPLWLLSLGFYELMKKTRGVRQDTCNKRKKLGPARFNFFLVHKTSDRIKVDLCNRFLLLYELMRKVLRHLKTP